VTSDKPTGDSAGEVKSADGQGGGGGDDRTIQAHGAMPAPAPVFTAPDTAPAVPAGGVPPGIDSRGRYRVRREIGRGGMGRVLLVQDEHLHREVALKELVAASGQKTATMLARFLREARLSGRLGHPSIIPVHDLGEHPDGRPYYTMRFVEGQGFDAALRGCTTLGERLHLLPNFRDVCNALAFAHSRNIIHRDLKPGNIILGAFGETVVVDWGLAKILGDGPLDDADEVPDEASNVGPAASGAAREMFTRAGSILGTPAYMSPEQTLGCHDVIDARSDQYSLGAILYEILTGRTPHQADSVQGMLLKVASAPIIPVAEIEPRAPRELRVIAEKALAKDPADRYESTQALAADLTAYLSGEKVASVSYTPRELVQRFLRKHRGAVAAGILALVSLFAALAIVTWAYRRESVARRVATEARREEERERQKAQDAQALALTQKGRAEAALAQNLVEQRQAHFNLAQATLERARMMLRQRRFHDALLLGAASRLHNPAHPRSPWHEAGHGAAHPEAVHLLASADGVVLLAHASTSLSLQDVHLPEGPMILHGMLTNRLHWVDLSPDGRWFTHADGTDGITIRALADGKPVVRISGHAAPIEFAAFSKQAGFLLTVDRDGRAKWWSLPTGERLSTLELPDKDPGASLLALPGAPAFLWTTVRGAIWRIDVPAGRVFQVKPADEDEFNSVCLHPSGTYAVTTYREGTVKSTRLSDGQTKILLAIGRKDGYRCSFSDNGEKIHLTEYIMATHSQWAFSPDAQTLKPLVRHMGLPKLPLAYSPSHLSGYDWFGLSPEELGLWGQAVGGFRELVRGQGRQLESLRQQDAGNLLGVDAQGRVLHWRTRDPARREYSPHRDRIQLVRQSPDQRWFVSASWDKTLRVHQEGVFEGVQLGLPFRNTVWSVDWSPDGRMIAAIDSQGALRVHEAPGGRVLFEHDCADGQFPTVVFSADSNRLQVLSRHFAYTFALPSGELVRKVTGGASNTNGGPTDPSRRRAVFKGDRELMELDYETGARRSLLLPDLAFNDVLTCAALEGVALGGEVFVCVDLKYRVHVYRWPTLERITVLEGIAQALSSVRLHPDGKWILTSSDDGSCRIWDLGTGRPLLVFTAGEDEQSGLDAQFFQVSRDGRRLIMSEGRRVFSIPLDWTLSEMAPQALIELAERTTGQRLDGIYLKPRSETPSVRP